jgi:hypothetical protein
MWKRRVFGHLPPYLSLLPFTGIALLLSAFILHVAETYSLAVATFLAILLVGILALGGMVMYLARGQRKRKQHGVIKTKAGQPNPEALYALSDDGERIEIRSQTKQKTDSA